MDRLVNMLKAAGDDTRLRLLLLLLRGGADGERADPDHRPEPAARQPASEAVVRGGSARAVQGRRVGLLPRRRSGRRSEARSGSRLRSSRTRTPRCSPTMRAGSPACAPARAETAAAYFKANAPQWERIRSLHVPEQDVEKAIVRLLGKDGLADILDAGTGTGRMLELLSPHIGRGARHRRQPRDAGDRARPAGAGRGHELPGAARRRLSPALHRRRLEVGFRRRSVPSGAALSRRSAGGAARGHPRGETGRADPDRRFRAA